MKDNTYHYYAGNMVYKNDKSLNYLLFDEGLVNKVSGGYAYEYQLKDHLGNTRVTFQPNGSGTTTTQVAEYYPFGSSYLPVSPAGTNKYLYNGKEKQDDMLGGTALDWYDYGARFYDPQIGRWHTPDPLSQFLSPYNYGGNNPINNIDPSGIYTYNWNTGNYENNNGNVVSWDEVQANNYEEPKKKQEQQNSFNQQTASNSTGNQTTAATDNFGDQKKKDTQPGEDGVITEYFEASEAGIVALRSATHGSELFIHKFADARTYYATFSGGTKYIGKVKLLDYCKVLGKYTFASGFVVNVIGIAAGEQWGKAALNIGVEALPFFIGAGPGMVIGVIYFTVDKTVGWDRVFTPTPNHPGTFIDANGNMGIR